MTRSREDNSDAADRWLLKVAAVPAVIIGIVLVVIFLSPLGDGLSAGLPAVLTFAGVIISYSATVIGLSVQRQAQRRLAQEHQQTESRLELEQRENGKRLELDAAMRAGQLIDPAGTSTGASPGPAAVASGLLALTNLDQAELAVSLLVDLWSDSIDETGMQQDRNGRVSNEIAVLVINRALISDSPNAQLVAAELLCRNATKLTSTQSLHWPAILDGCWRPEFGKRTKLLLVEALINMTVCPTKPADEGALRAVAVRLFGIYQDPEDGVKACIGKLINALIPSLERCSSSEFAQGSVMVNIKDLCDAARDHPHHDNPDGYLRHLSDVLAARLHDWAENATGLPTAPGCLATAAAGAPSPPTL